MVFKRIGTALKSMPRIVSVREKSLMDYREIVPYRGITRETQQFFNDREAVTLFLWAVISPAMCLAYIVWTKYKHLRWLAIPLVIISLFQFFWQWKGITGTVADFLAPNG